MPKIYVLMGYSGSGKDSVCKIIQKHSKATNIKWSRPMKDMMERHYELPHGFLDDPVERLGLVPGHPDGINWLDLMIRCFEHLLAIDPLMMVNKVKKRINKTLSYDRDVILTDTRNWVEADYIDELSYSHPVTIIWVSRPEVEPKESDRYQEGIYQVLSRHQTPHVIINDGILDQLEIKTLEVIKYAN